MLLNIPWANGLLIGMEDVRVPQEKQAKCLSSLLIPLCNQTLDVLLQILVVFPKVDALQSKVMSFIHRMVEVLGGAVFPFAAMIGSRMLSIALCFWKAKTPKRRESIDLGIPYMELPGVVPDLQKW
ncbi:uncharacterized protein LOC113281635 [Papaver somniferum]|uniref:uncharacterized protein LOC113281635 n=1 Tax=Papaver somniferum TaxID=3469 RepID=UPI000E6F8754|nr:uncharacterized protein LOC113281635 [Papaver somniferum]XP_026386207.1 uncharacterized protein LOC113281635 [Papaver somniferum]